MNPMKKRFFIFEERDSFMDAQVLFFYPNCELYSLP